MDLFGWIAFVVCIFGAWIIARAGRRAGAAEARQLAEAQAQADQINAGIMHRIYERKGWR